MLDSCGPSLEGSGCGVLGASWWLGWLQACCCVHSGFSQLYFVRAAFPVSIVASAWGLTLLLDNVRLRVLLPRMVVALGAGMLLAKILSELTRISRSSAGCHLGCNPGALAMACRCCWSAPQWPCCCVKRPSLAGEQPGSWPRSSAGTRRELANGAHHRGNHPWREGVRLRAGQADCSHTRRQIPAGGAAPHGTSGTTPKHRPAGH